MATTFPQEKDKCTAPPKPQKSSPKRFGLGAALGVWPWKAPVGAELEPASVPYGADTKPPRADHAVSACAGSGKVQVVVVRHGERLDEVDREAWRRLRTQDNRNDPPLTPAGAAQARQAGLEICKSLPHLQDAGERLVVYSSPTARTLGTAAALAPVLRVKTIVPAYALNCCAAAKGMGVAKAFPKEPPGREVLDSVTLACWPPEGDVDAVDRRQGRHLGTFADSVRELAACQEAGTTMVLVTHREGIWELQQYMRERPSRAKYCSVSYYTFDLQTGVLSLPEEMKRSPKPQRALGRAVLQGKAYLFQTPGVSAGAKPLDDGEEVEVLSEPQCSEGPSGELFVLIGRRSGEQGWLRVVDCKTSL